MGRNAIHIYVYIYINIYIYTHIHTSTPRDSSVASSGGGSAFSSSWDSITISLGTTPKGGGITVSYAARNSQTSVP